MSAKSDAQMALDEKIDLARTLIRYKARRLAARELNEAEDLIKKAHDAEVANGGVTQIELEAISFSSLSKGLPSGDNTDSSATDDGTDSPA